MLEDPFFFNYYYFECSAHNEKSLVSERIFCQSIPGDPGLVWERLSGFLVGAWEATERQLSCSHSLSLCLLSVSCCRWRRGLILVCNGYFPAMPRLATANKCCCLPLWMASIRVRTFCVFRFLFVCFVIVVPYPHSLLFLFLCVLFLLSCFLRASATIAVFETWPLFTAQRDPPELDQLNPAPSWTTRRARERKRKKNTKLKRICSPSRYNAARGGGLLI